jgi:hypothetical protein
MMKTTTDRKPTGRTPGDKVVRMCPDNELKAPAKRFGETFSAETVVMEAFFPGK